MINFVVPSDFIWRIIVSTPFVGIRFIVITPSPRAVASDVNEITGRDDGFWDIKALAESENTGPTIMSGLVDRAVLIAVPASVAVS